MYLFRIYEDDALQFLPMEEGRVRPVRDGNGAITSFTYDYFVKDHLGNVRMVLTEEQKQDQYPAATLEGNLATSTDAVYIEKNYYDIKSDYIVNKSTATGLTDYPNNNGNPPYNNNPNSNVTANSEKVYRLHAATNKTGLGITLKVMAGDQIDIYGKSYWFNNGGNYSDKFPVPVSSLIDAFLGAPAMVGKGVTAAGISTPSLLGDLEQFQNRPNNLDAPWAYINWIFFDEQFKFAGSGFQQVGSNGVLKDHQLVNVPSLKAPKNGYVFVYCSNESQQYVYFDNLQVFHNRGPLLEETHYYPFGLTMAGISSKALDGAPENKYKFNGIEFNNDFDINQYDAFYRNYNPQIGRWFQVDPKPTDYESPYAAMGNNPVLRNDFLGDTSIFYNAAGEQIQRLVDGRENNTITVIPQDKQKGFNLIINAGEAVKAFYKDAKGNFDKGAYAAALREVGVTYDYNAYFAYFDLHSKDFYTGNYYEPYDGKGPLINEHMSKTKIVNGHMEIVPGTDSQGGPFNSSTSGDGDGDVHTHGSENRRFLYPDAKDSKRSGNSLAGKYALGDHFSGDLGRKGQKAGTAKFDIAVSKTFVYLYHQGRVVIAISRNGNGSKNPGSIK